MWCGRHWMHCWWRAISSVWPTMPPISPRMSSSGCKAPTFAIMLVRRSIRSLRPKPRPLAKGRRALQEFDFVCHRRDLRLHSLLTFLPHYLVWARTALSLVFLVGSRLTLTAGSRLDYARLSYLLLLQTKS